MENTKLYEYLKGKNITESSLKLYMNNLRRLNGGEYPKSLTFLRNVEKIVGDLEKYKPNTRRCYLISIVTSLKGDPKMKKLYDKYYTLLEEYNKAGAVNNEKSETQKENWISQDEVKKVYDELTAEVKPLLEKKKLSTAEYDRVLYWVTLSLYTLQKPRRNADYQLAYLVGSKIPDNKDVNYLDMSSGKWYFNNYKTKGTYSTQIVDATPEMMEVIREFLKVHPLRPKKKNYIIPLLVTANGEPFKQKNTITKILNKVFGKKIGVSMLRNIYLTDKFGDKVKELEQTSEQMGTSSNTIMNNYVKID